MSGLSAGLVSTGRPRNRACRLTMRSGNRPRNGRIRADSGFPAADPLIPSPGRRVARAVCPSMQSARRFEIEMRRAGESLSTFKRPSRFNFSSD
jgi:hypothetical protein